ncbi:probable apyrase 6 isoform X1 [Magnolia sinica]|uniref:probable apyrase 6 isoform X1 n=1 Tax=Magnolia sinica TaxID=86752 RepID=UPI002658A364|nr:probable apyrase 6 isoform X1 [Magnolia sinica]
MDFSNLQSRISTAYIPPHRTQLHPRMHSFSSPLSKPLPSQSTPPHHLKWWYVAAALLTLAFLLYLFSLARGVHLSSRFSDPKSKGFGIVIHVGPTATRARVFEFLNEGHIVPFANGRGPDLMTTHVGLAEFAANVENAGNSLRGLLGFAREKVPKVEWKDTKVRMVVTGGLQRDATEVILELCRKVLRSSGFMFKDEWVSLVTGEEEGIYAWVAANYALGTLGGDPQETTGLIELGGASAQITFAPREPPPREFLRTIKVAGVTYNLYSQSMPQFGQDATWELLHEKHNSRVLLLSSDSIGGVVNPCIPKGYNKASDRAIALKGSDDKLPESHSAGNFSACRSKALTLLQKGQETCLHPPCTIVSSFMPELRGKRLVAENFFFTSELFGLVPKTSLSEIEAAGRHYCEDDWAKQKNEHHGIDEADLLRYCFSSAYIIALLHDGLGIPMDDKRVGFSNRAAGAPLDWTLGAFILQTVEPDTEPEDLTYIVGDDSVTYITLFAILFLAILAAFYITRWRKPQLKTVYDLEKGRYIVTRVPR